MTAFCVSLLSVDPWVSKLLWFVGGILFTSIVNHYTGIFTFRRKRQIVQEDHKARVLEVLRRDQGFLSEFLEDIQNPDLIGARKIFVTPTEKARIGATNQFVYYRNRHPNIDGILSDLEHLGMLTDISSDITPKFRIHRDLIDIAKELIN